MEHVLEQMSKHRSLFLLIGFGACVFAYFFFKPRKAIVDLGSSNGDVMEAYSTALVKAHQWHWWAFPGSLNLTTGSDGRVVLTTYFYGKSLFQRHTDVLIVEVDLSNNDLLETYEAKGGLEPSYDNARPMNVHLGSDWHEVLALADHAYGSGFKQQHVDACSTVLIQTDRWYVTYSSDSSGKYVHLTVFDASSHQSISNTVSVNDSGLVQPHTSIIEL